MRVIVPIRTGLLVLCLLWLAALLPAQVLRHIVNDKGEAFDTPAPHPLTWWTTDPLRLDPAGDLMIGLTIDNGVVVKTSDYRVQQNVTVLGVVAGNRIVQIISTIRARLGLRNYGRDLGGSPPTQWKSLLVQPPGSSQYIEIYQLHAFSVPKISAKIYGTGSSAILSTDDSDGGNGGGCSDGYWWFDKAGPHSVDFKPLYAAMTKAAPPNSIFPTHCWAMAMHPEDSSIQTWVQSKDAKCRVCGGLGELHAEYAIRNGVAEPIRVKFKPETLQ